MFPLMKNISLSRLGNGCGLKLVLLLALVFAGAGCRSTTKTRVFLLSGDDALQRLENAHVSVELRPVDLPTYLNRREFVTRIGEDEIQILRSWLWAETPEHSINVAFEQNLKALLGADSVRAFGMGDGKMPVLQISVRSLEVADGMFVADFRCRLKRVDGESLEKRLTWTCAAEADMPYVKYYKMALSALARQTADWLVQCQ